MHGTFEGEARPQPRKAGPLPSHLEPPFAVATPLFGPVRASIQALPDLFPKRGLAEACCGSSKSGSFVVKNNRISFRYAVNHL